MDRHDRQRRVAGVGPAGQARIARASVEVRLRGSAADVATRYLAGAGVAALAVPHSGLAQIAASIDASVPVRVDPALPDDAAPGYDLRDPSACEVARGARAALLALRAALEEVS
jgi:hypothetical protein